MEKERSTVSVAREGWIAKGKKAPKQKQTEERSVAKQLTVLGEKCGEVESLLVSEYLDEELELDKEPEEVEEACLKSDVSAVPRLVNGQWKLGYDIDAAYNREVESYRLLTREEEQVLLERYLSTKDKDARDRLIACNQRLVRMFAKHYSRKYHVPFLDLVQEGSIGLMKAVDRFLFEKECKLSTYATAWIKQNIERWIMNNNRTVRLPVYIQEILAKSRRASHRLLKTLGREPTKKEICKEIGISLKRLTIAEEGLRKIFSTDVSISVSDEDSDLLGDFLEDERPLPDEQLHNQELSDKVIRPALATLKPRAKFVMVMRFGIEGVMFSEREIVAAMSSQNRMVSLGMVRRIEESMVRKLNPPQDVLFDRRAIMAWLRSASREALTLDEDTIFILRYGIGALESSLEGVAARIEVTRERIRQIEEKTFIQLKRTVGSGLLRNERKKGIFIELD